MIVAVHDADAKQSGTNDVVLRPKLEGRNRLGEEVGQ